MQEWLQTLQIVSQPKQWADGETPAWYCHDEVEGRFPKRRRLNGDQVPCQFVFTPTCIWATEEERKEKMVKFKTPGKQWTKRFCTLQLNVPAQKPATKEQRPKSAIIFRGKGLRITELERSSYDPRVAFSFSRKRGPTGSASAKLLKCASSPGASSSGGKRRSSCWTN
jgi:hypothetical protein